MTTYAPLSGPVALDGIYTEKRSIFDGFIGWVDGAANLTNSVGNVVEGVAGIRADWAEGQSAWDTVVLDREEREQGLLEDLIKVNRGDNVRLYYALGGAAILAVFLMR